MTTQVQMLMCGKVTNDNLIDSSHYFRNTDQYEKLMWGFSYIKYIEAVRERQYGIMPVYTPLFEKEGA